MSRIGVIDYQELVRPYNFDARNNRITLGRNTYTANRYGFTDYQDWRVSMPNARLGLTTLISGPSTGKTVLMQRIMGGWILCDPSRPGLILDNSGDDFRCTRYPSKHGFLFTKNGEYRWGLGDRLVNLSPQYLAEDCEYDDIFFAIAWTDLEEEEWEYLLKRNNDARTWINSFMYILEIMKSSNQTFSSMLWHIERAAFSKKKDSIIPREITKPELQAMLKALKRIYKKKYLVEREDPAAKVDIIGMLEQGLIVNCNFFGDESVQSALYQGVILRRFYQYYRAAARRAKRQGRMVDPPWTIVEEASKLTPKNKNGRRDETPGLHWLVEVITKGLKHGFKFGLIYQEAQHISPRMRDIVFANPLLVCNLTVPDIKEIISKYGTEKQDLLQQLDIEFDEYFTTEWCLILSNRFLTFRPAAAPMAWYERFDRGDNHGKDIPVQG